MEILFSTEISIPFFQVVLLISISTLMLLFGKIRVALLTNYLFTFYWGFWINLDRSDIFNTWFHFSYVGFGLMIVVLALFGFFQKIRERFFNMSFYCKNCDSFFPFFITKGRCPLCDSGKVRWISL